MKVINLTYPHQLNRADLPETVCAIGFFDGVHLGHQTVIKEAVQYAQEKGIESAVISFFPHPKVVLSRGKEKVNYITPPLEKIEIMKDLGVDRLYTITFNEDLSKLEPSEFIEQFIIGLNIRHLVAGFDFTYGYKGQGNMTNIKDFSKGSFTYKAVDKVTISDRKISSTYIRELIKAGNLSKANDLLDRPLQIRGTVIEGRKRGREIGFPTANIETSDEVLLPKAGVYAVMISVDHQSYIGMANLGFRPTFEKDQKEALLEVHILDFNQKIYGKEVKIYWHEFIRDEKKFNSIDELVGQLQQDQEAILNFFKNK